METSLNTQNTIYYSFQKALDARYSLNERQKNHCMLFCYFHQNDFPIPMHTHEFYEINIITKGTGTHYIENNSFSINSGDFFIIPPNIKHGYSEQSELTIFHIILSEKFFKKYGNDLCSIHGFSLLFNIEPQLRTKRNMKIFPSISPGSFMYFLTEINKLYKLNQLSDGHETEKCIKTLNLISEFAAIITSDQFKDVKKHFVDIPQITTVLSFIDNNYSEKITLEDLCKISNMSRSTLLNQFHAICNCSPSDYIRTVRLENAKKMLTESNLSIASIAQDCGFYDSAHLSRTFLQMVGQLPKDYRNNCNNS